MYARRRRRATRAAPVHFAHPGSTGARHCSTGPVGTGVGRLLLDRLRWYPGQHLCTDVADRAVLLWPDDAGVVLVGARGDLTVPAAVRQICASLLRSYARSLYHLHNVGRPLRVTTAA